VGGALFGFGGGAIPGGWDLSARAGELWEWALPPGVPEPRVPADNPMSAAKVELGRHLFYDTRLSENRSQSCASCHQQRLAFTDGKARAVGSTGEVHPRSSMSLANAAWTSTLGWAHPDTPHLEDQMLGPLFGTDPVEMGMAERERELIGRLKDSEVYPELFAAAFPGGEGITLPGVYAAIAAFERSLVSFDSPWDRWALRGERGAVPREARDGAELFFSIRLGCAECHAAPFFTTSVAHVESRVAPREFFNTGVHDVDGAGSYPDSNTGIHAHTGDWTDMGRFRAPTLRNIAVTAPYMHDGSVATLGEVLVEHYGEGGRARSHLTDESMVRFGLDNTELASVIAFLEALTDSTFLSDPRHSDPWVNRAAR